MSAACSSYSFWRRRRSSIVDAEFSGNHRKGVKGGLGAVPAGQPQFVGAPGVFGQPCPAHDGGQCAALDEDGHRNHDRHDENDEVAVRGMGHRCGWWPGPPEPRRVIPRRGIPTSWTRCAVASRHVGCAEPRAASPEPGIITVVISTHATRVVMTTPVTASVSKTACPTPPSEWAIPRTAPGSWTPTNTHREPLIRNVARSQNANAWRRDVPGLPAAKRT